jgi:WD40 repeat protein
MAMDGWPGVTTEPAEFKVPVQARKTVYQTQLSSRHRAAWPIGEHWHVRGMQVAPDGREVSAIGSRSVEYGDQYKSGADAYRLCRWQIKDGQAKQVLDVSLDKVLDLNAERERFLAQKLRFTYWNVLPTISDAKFSADGRWLAVITQRPDELRKAERGHEIDSWAGRIVLIDARTGEIAQRLETEDLPFHNLCFSPDGRTLAAVRSNNSRAESKVPREKRAGEVRLWEVANGRPQATIRLDPGENIRNVVFSPDGKTLALSCSAPDPSSKKQRNLVKLWDVARNSTLTELADREDIRFVASGHYLVGQRRNDHEGKVCLYDLDTKDDRNVFTYDIPKQVPYGASSHVYLLTAADSRFVLCCFYDGRVFKLELPSGSVVAEQKATTQDDHTFYNAWAVSADGRYLAGSVNTWPPYRVGGNLPEDWQEVPPAKIHIWETAKLTRVETLTGHEGGFTQIALAGNGQWLLSAGGRPEAMDPLLRLWDLNGVESDDGAKDKAGNDEKAAPEPSVKIVKYDPLQDTIKQFRGKVVVVDYWADT